MRAYPSGSFVCRGLTSPALLRFHFPLVEPDVQSSRIRLPEKDLTLWRTRLCTAWCPDAPSRQRRKWRFHTIILGSGFATFVVG